MSEPVTGHRLETGLLPGDYIAADDGLYFAVVLHGTSDHPVHCSLRYVYRKGEPPRKLGTSEAYKLLESDYPRYLAYSEHLDTETILVPGSDITEIYRPVETLCRIGGAHNNDELTQTAATAAELLIENGVQRNVLGITGSLMLGFQHANSDIDILIYDRDDFRLARTIIKHLLETGTIHSLDETTWLETYKRRACSLEFNDYKKHEIRKYNKFILGSARIDIKHIPLLDILDYKKPSKKLGPATIKAKITDDSRIFSYPACYTTDNREIRQILCYTATYTGQAFAGEYIEASGMLECDAEGRRYMVIGTSREAPGEYIKVVGL